MGKKCSKSSRPSEKLTITLTDRRPISVDTTVWALIAEVSDHDNQSELEANRKWKLYVRQCQTGGDDRCVVYGSFNTVLQNESDRSGGEIVDSLDKVPAAVKRLAQYLEAEERLAGECIARLPADEL